MNTPVTLKKCDASTSMLCTLIMYVLHTSPTCINLGTAKWPKIQMMSQLHK